jgi:hypothetical protein
MRPHTKRPARSTVRLGLESLEDRTLPSAGLTTQTLGSGFPSTAGQTRIQGALQAQSANFTYSWSVGPGPVITGTNPDTGNGKSTGSVVMPLYPPGGGSVQVGGPAGTIPVGVLLTSSAAGNRHPDAYNSPFTLSVHLQDRASGAFGTLTFAGTLSGTLSWDHSTLAISFANTRQTITLGGRVYTVTLPQEPLHLPISGYALHVDASVQVGIAAPRPRPGPGSGSGQVGAASFSYQGGVGPSSVLTGRNSATRNGKSTGSVDLALYYPGTASALPGGAAANVPIALVSTTSSAGPTRPDQFNTPLTITLQVKDRASGASGTATFHGTLSGAMRWDQSSLTITFSNITQTLTLGGRLYTVMLPAGLYHIHPPGMGAVLIQAQVRVS